MKETRKIVLLIVVFVGLLLCSACQKDNTTEAKVTSTNDTAAFAKGADVSWVTQMEASNIRFYNSAGTATECMTLLKSLGVNSIRLRAWVNPSGGWCNTKDLLVKALRAKNLGMRIMIDFHYSDTWADPSDQAIPVAWASLGFSALETAMTNYTTNVLDTLKTNGITPEWVQVGNETGNGMMWPAGNATTSMANYAALVTTGYNAVKAVFPNTKVIIHLQNGYDNSLYEWLFDGLKNNGAKWDVIGMSLYPSTTDWSSYNTQCLANMNDMVSRYGSEVMICEVGMPWDSPTICQSFLTDLIAKVKSVSNNKGLGVFYWEPECYNNWQNYTLGAFDNTGKPTVALNAFN
jgi:arabinogalactan endo-1,4-beta-galactosidase